MNRWTEFDASRIPDPPWNQVWALTARALTSGGGTRELETFLWRWRWSGWVISLDADPDICPVCGEKMSAEGQRRHGRRSSCSNACRQLRARTKKAGEPTPWAAQVADARQVRAQLEEAAEAATRWLTRRFLLHPGTIVLPPNWVSLRQAPVLPSRCRGSCEGTCAHTGGPCLFAAVGRTE